jgi:hypothetical protein
MCKNCWKLYLGQTKRRKDEREKEHDRAIRLNHPDLSAVGPQMSSREHFKSHNLRGEILKENLICDMKYWS